MILLAIDPGTAQSAYVVYDGERVLDFGILPNQQLLVRIRALHYEPHDLSDLFNAKPEECLIEMIGHYGTGMSVGKEVFDTCLWIGRYLEAWYESMRCEANTCLRKTIATQICGTARAKDKNIRQALIDRFGGSTAIGRKATPGPLYGISADAWQALAVAVTYFEKELFPAEPEPTV